MKGKYQTYFNVTLNTPTKLLFAPLCCQTEPDCLSRGKVWCKGADALPCFDGNGGGGGGAGVCLKCLACRVSSPRGGSTLETS